MGVFIRAVRLGEKLFEETDPQEVQFHIMNDCLEKGIDFIQVTKGPNKYRDYNPIIPHATYAIGYREDDPNHSVEMSYSSNDDFFTILKRVCEEREGLPMEFLYHEYAGIESVYDYSIAKEILDEFNHYKPVIVEALDIFGKDYYDYTYVFETYLKVLEDAIKMKGVVVHS